MCQLSSQTVLSIARASLRVDTCQNVGGVLYSVYTRLSYLGPQGLTYSTVLEARVYTEFDIRTRTRSMGLRTRLDCTLIECGHNLIDHVRNHGAS